MGGKGNDSSITGGEVTKAVKLLVGRASGWMWVGGSHL